MFAAPRGLPRKRPDTTKSLSSRPPDSPDFRRSVCNSENQRPQLRKSSKTALRNSDRPGRSKLDKANTPGLGKPVSGSNAKDRENARNRSLFRTYLHFSVRFFLWDILMRCLLKLPRPCDFVGESGVNTSVNLSHWCRSFSTLSSERPCMFAVDLLGFDISSYHVVC